MDIKKMTTEMDAYGFAYEPSTDEDKMTKTYKCYLSKKCNDEKYDRIKKMFDFVKDDPDFKDHMGSDFAKLSEAFSTIKRGEGTKKIDFAGMTSMHVFITYKMGVKEVCKKGYVLGEDDTYIKAE